MSDNIRAVAEKKADAKIEFYKNFISYVVVNAILAVINFLFTPDIWWVLFPLFIWGIGVLFDFLKAFVLYGRFDGEEYRERKIEQEMEKLRK
ncbi:MULTISPECIES: 2TM domain-containing protein [Methanobrevibacter]|uniref:2TM domain-containing protein n=1 Tax=Methanobrevibacter TaxID=2172 RepID=UPI0025CEDD0F|nr:MULTISPECIES: 2TM domain-containing protein [Methanobrevibacter]MDY3097750.1 2TM domain-containing protein [Methanobrevibacter sp.]